MMEDERKMEARCPECGKLLFKYIIKPECPEGFTIFKRISPDPLRVEQVKALGEHEFIMEIKCPRCSYIVSGIVTITDTETLEALPDGTLNNGSTNPHN